MAEIPTWNVGDRNPSITETIKVDVNLPSVERGSALRKADPEAPVFSSQSGRHGNAQKRRRNGSDILARAFVLAVE